MLGLDGWFSTNILGNRDGEVLDDPDSSAPRKSPRPACWISIPQPDLYPSLYGNLYHKVRINYYPRAATPRKAGDAIDIRGWLGYPMQMKVDFLCRGFHPGGA